MDILVVAAAAGAGYIAQHWKDITRGGQNILESSSGNSSSAKSEFSPSMQQLQDKDHLFRRLGRRKNIEKDVLEEREPVSQGASSEVTSTSGSDGRQLVLMGNYEDCNHNFADNSGDLLHKLSSTEIGSSYDYARTKRILKSNKIKGQVVKPLNSLESCFIAQLYKGHTEMEEYVLNSITSLSTPIVRPLLVTDRSRVISRASGDFLDVRARPVVSKLERDSCLEEKGTIFGVPPLPNAGRKREVKTRRDGGVRLSSPSKMTSGISSNSQGSSQGALLFFLGISVGIISSFLSNQQEVDKLNDLLKQMQNLIQDLKEELEVKDSLIVKELALDYISQDTLEDTYGEKTPHEFSSEHNLYESTKKAYNEDPGQKTKEESMKKIEAELEVELARLELNLDSSNLEAYLPDLVELDPDFVPDIAHGELRTDIFGRQACDQPYTNQDESGSLTPHPANYAVSPIELSLRLHEVIQSRLEERVKELETALQNSQKEVKYRETEQTKSWRKFSNSVPGSSSIRESPIAEEENLAEQPVLITLFGDALHACNEAYDVFAKIDWSEEEELPFGGNNEDQESIQKFDTNLQWIENGGLNNYTPPRHSVSSRNAYLTFIHQESEDHTSSSKDISTSGDEVADNDHDEKEKKLIKKILEKARKGSPAVLNAQKVLFSPYEN